MKSIYREGAKKQPQDFFGPLRNPSRLCGMLFLIAPGLITAQEVKTIKPGMTVAEVRAEWGEPLTVRTAGIMSYLYYESECLKKCGTNDVVFLENGQVVDAVVRDRKRRYDGVASSPPERKPELTAPQ